MAGFNYLIEAPEPAVVLELIEREQITSFFAPPTVWISLLRHADFDRRDLSSLRRLIYGASIMPVPVLEELRRRLPGAGPYNAYGQSEIAPLATVLRPEEHDARPASVGRPVLNVRTRVVDPEMRDCSPGVPGEIVHRSPQLLQGYWEMPEETARAFEGGWFHSGDIGTMDEAGYITVVDRLKDLINTGGIAGRQPGGRGGAIHASDGGRGGRDRHAGPEMDRGGDGGRGAPERGGGGQHRGGRAKLDCARPGTAGSRSRCPSGSTSRTACRRARPASY